MAGDRPDHEGHGGTHNELSGSAHAAAQVHTVYGGVHMHDPTPSGRRAQLPHQQTRWMWAAFGMAVIAVALSTTSTILVVRQSAPGTAKPTTADTRSTATSEALPDIPPRYPMDKRVPKNLNAARKRSQIKIPEKVDTESFGIHECASRIQQRAISGFLPLPRTTADLPALARYYADTFFETVWTVESRVLYDYPRSISRSNDGRVTYPGVQLDGEFDSSAPDGCGDGRGVVKALALDHGDCYLVFIVIVGLEGDTRYGERSSEQDAQILLDSMGPF